MTRERHEGLNKTSASNESLSPKKHRGMFFGAEIENTVTSIKSELTHQTGSAFEVAKSEYAHIKELFKTKMAERTNEAIFRDKLEDYVENITFLCGLMPILSRVQSYCDFVNDALLPAMEVALQKIRAAHGCDLTNPETWSVAHLHTDKISRDATWLACSKLKLNRLSDCVYDEMEWFVLSYKAAAWENKRKFYAALNENPQLMAWVQPFIDIAEGRTKNWESALNQAMSTVANENVLLVEKRNYE